VPLAYYSSDFDVASIQNLAWSNESGLDLWRALGEESHASDIDGVGFRRRSESRLLSSAEAVPAVAGAMKRAATATSTMQEAMMAAMKAAGMT
jgi:hypothetical protein